MIASERKRLFWYFSEKAKPQLALRSEYSVAFEALPLGFVPSLSLCSQYTLYKIFVNHKPFLPLKETKNSLMQVVIVRCSNL